MTTRRPGQSRRAFCSLPSLPRVLDLAAGEQPIEAVVHYRHACSSLPAPRTLVSCVSPASDEVRAALAALVRDIEACTLCPLYATRTRAVPGEGDPGADLMFVGEAPGYHEDQQGRPFVGQAGKLLSDLLASIGLTREQVFIANVLKSRPPNNRDPLPEEIAACQPFLWRQIELIRPKVICTLGNHATKLISGNPAGITRVHGRPQVFESGAQTMYLYPIFHPAAALYTRAMLTTLQDDFSRLPELLSRPRPVRGGTDSQALAAAERESQVAPAATPASAAEPGAPVLPATVSGEIPAAAADRPPEASPPRAEPEQLNLF